MVDAKAPAQRATASRDVWSDEERAAMRETARERRAASRRRSAPDRSEGEQEVLAAIARMPERDRVMAERLHEVITAAGPDLWPRTWYGSPAYYGNGNLICFFQETAKFKTRYIALGFSDKAHLDDGAMWPVGYALLELTPEVEARIAELVRRAAG